MTSYFDMNRRARSDAELNPDRAIGAGIAAAGAYLLVMYADMVITRSPSDDLLMLGRPFTSNPRRARLIDLPMHMGFGTVVGLAYGSYGHCWLRGPNWLRGVAMMAIENTVLWPMAIFADRVHPSMLSGELPMLNTPVPFVQQLARHAAFGLVLGSLYGDGGHASWQKVGLFRITTAGGKRRTTCTTCAPTTRSTPLRGL